MAVAEREEQLRAGGRGHPTVFYRHRMSRLFVRPCPSVHESTSPPDPSSSQRVIIFAGGGQLQFPIESVLLSRLSPISVHYTY